MSTSRNLSRPRHAKTSQVKPTGPKRLRCLTLHHNVKSVSFRKDVKKNDKIILKKSETREKKKGKTRFVLSQINSIHFKQNTYLVYHTLYNSQGSTIVTRNVIHVNVIFQIIFILNKYSIYLVQI